MKDRVTFRTEGIDHVALAVRNVAESVAWYCDVLGLERQHEHVWGDYPAVVSAGTTSLALFPVSSSTPKPPPGRDTLTMRHVAFRVDRANFDRARTELAARGIVWQPQHHGIAESIYFPDPDGHQIEITTYELAD